ncbi:type IV toxin-antitoxin system AbiEi family antitoxin domain-containing protein [Arthrobacter sp. TMN-49]
MDSQVPSPKHDAVPRSGSPARLSAVPRSAGEPWPTSAQPGSGPGRGASFHRVPVEATLGRFRTAFPDRRVVWRTSQLREAGFDDRAIRRLLEGGAILRVRQGCYVRAAYWYRQSSTGRERLRVVLHSFATLNTSASGFVYSHVSAARLHGLCLWEADTLIHLTQPGKPSSIGHGKDSVVHARALPEQDVVTIDGLQVTSLERTVIDCCLTMRYKQALIVADHALHLGANIARLRATAETLGAHRGIRTLRKVLRHADKRSESPGETLARDLMRELLIPAPVPQLWIATRLGVFRADFAWPGKRLILEFDGQSKYFDYAPTEQVLLEERQRENALIEDGWRVIRVQWKDLFNEQSFKARILAALAR